MAKLIQYIDRERATIAALRDYRDQLWKLEADPERIKELRAIIEAPARGVISQVTTRGSRSTEDRVDAMIDRVSVLEQGYQQAEEYQDELAPCWARLSPEERDMLTLRWVDWDEGGGIDAIMAKYHVEKSAAYERSNAALKRLSLLLFW